jgi:hypothetical protein
MNQSALLKTVVARQQRGEGLGKGRMHQVLTVINR